MFAAGFNSVALFLKLYDADFFCFLSNQGKQSYVGKKVENQRKIVEKSLGVHEIPTDFTGFTQQQ